MAQSTRFAGILYFVWATGSSGESKLGALLEELNDGERVVVLHDRRIPGSRANIDHIVVRPSGVYVIDAKKYTGKVQKIDRGGFFSVDLRLYVGRRDCTKLLVGTAKQVEVVKGPPRAAGSELAMTVTPVICFVEVEWSLFARPFQLDGVHIEWPRSLASRLAAPGHVEADTIRAIASVLASALPLA